jgi:hypothetical protein
VQLFRLRVAPNFADAQNRTLSKHIMENYNKDNLKNSDYVLRDNDNKIHNNEFLCLNAQSTHAQFTNSYTHAK